MKHYLTLRYQVPSFSEGASRVLDFGNVSRDFFGAPRRLRYGNFLNGVLSVKLNNVPFGDTHEALKRDGRLIARDMDAALGKIVRPNLKFLNNK
jgi:hypothetical protein